ncbi:hypothetical protein [Propionivibrio limicola]|uniref:hypothetical protein n=1 Tax=Propionivibrio limicola TaxID=167645 RepID=UPI0012925907|nr:hypothetical protein [Propionivibrio limicola]
MRNESHKTFTGALRDTVEAWRKQNGWSRETAVMQIVEAHNRLGGPAVTGIDFDPPSRDAFSRAKTNADRVFRWLDDVTKDTNPCPPNFIPSILAALPTDSRLALLNTWFAPLGVVCRAAEPEAQDYGVLVMFKELVNSSAGAQNAVADMLDGVDAGELEHTHVALCNVLHCVNKALKVTEARLSQVYSKEQEA